MEKLNITAIHLNYFLTSTKFYLTNLFKIVHPFNVYKYLIFSYLINKIWKKNIVGDFFKTIDTAKEDIESQIEKNKTKLYDTFPALKEMEEKFSSKAEEMKSTIKETINNAKGSFSRTEDSNVEEATIVEESEK